MFPFVVVGTTGVVWLFGGVGVITVCSWVGGGGGCNWIGGCNGIGGCWIIAGAGSAFESSI